MKVRGEAPLWPPNPAPYITEWLFEIGPTTAGAMGDGPISWGEITEWQRNIGIDLDPWEAHTIRELSKAFIAQRHDAERPDCQAPYSGAADQIEAVRDRVTDQFAAMFRAITATQSS